MAGISSKAAGKLENRFKFNDGTELTTDLALDWYETDFRSYDAQLGRFHQIDPLGELFEYESLYVFSGNNPILFNDPLGLSKTTDSTRKASLKPIPAPKPPPSSAGAPPLPQFPNPFLRPVDPVPKPDNPGKVINLNQLTEPPPVEKINWWPIGIRATGIIGALLIPTPTGEGASLPNGILNPFIGHGNRKDNSNPHIVYQFSFIPPAGDKRTPILKYGISDYYQYGIDRPASQLLGLQMLYGKSVTWRLMTRTNNRAEALMMERLYVEQHLKVWGERPRAQIKP